MNDQTDSQLLRAYAENRSDLAFAELARRHVDLVYSAALRMDSDASRRRLNSGRVSDLSTGRPATQRARNSTRRVLPLMVLGSSFTNSISRGYL